MNDLSPLREFIIKLLAQRGDHDPFNDDDSLALSGRLDSMDLMEIAFFLEDQYDVDYGRTGIKHEDLDSIKIIDQLISNIRNSNPE